MESFRYRVAKRIQAARTTGVRPQNILARATEGKRILPGARKEESLIAGGSMGGARHLCRFTIRLFEGMARFQAFVTSEVEAA